MSSTIPSQLPPFVAAVRSGALQALALQAGQVLDGKIIGPAPNGGTQVEIRGQMLNLVLPTLLKAGETIKLEVQGSGPQMRLALQVATPATTPASPAPAAPAPQASMPLPNPTSTVVAQAPSPGTGTPAPAQPSVPQAVVTTTPLPPQSEVQGPVPAPAQGQQAPANSAAPVPTTAQAAPPAASAYTPPKAAAPAAPSVQAAGAPPAPAPVQFATTTAVTTAPLPVSVYPQAAAATPAGPNPHAVAVPAVAAAPTPAAAAPVSGAVRPVIAATAIANATAHPSAGNPSPQAPPQQAATPQAALTQMVQAAVPSQGSVTALTTALTSIAGKVVLPEPVVRAAQQVLAGRVAIASPRFDGAALQAAVRSSGVFQEAGLASGQPLLQPDMKSALLTLRQTLTTWLGNQAPVAAPTQIAPPLRGSIPRAKAGDPPPLDPSDPPEEIGKQLLERTESALSRVRLHQHASLPDPVGKTADWSMDLPVMVGTHQTLMQLQIHRDQHSDGEAAAERGWQMRFALSVPAVGEVGAQVTMRAGTVGVMLWATDPAASAALDAEIQDLRDSLAGTGLHPGAVIVRHGEPPALPSSPPSGHFLDARS